jgi:hypothetical protein
MQLDSLIQEYSAGMLGQLPSPFCMSPVNGTPMIMDGDAMINGVALPQRVIEELRRQGIPLSWYTPGELEDALEACSFDSQLIDDVNGVNFHDKLTLTKAEQRHFFKEKYLRERSETHSDEEDLEQYASF